MQGLLEAQEVPEAKKVKIVMGALGGDAKREISVLADGDRDKANKIFEHLDTLYAGEIPIFSVADRGKMNLLRHLCCDYESFIAGCGDIVQKGPLLKIN